MAGKDLSQTIALNSYLDNINDSHAPFGNAPLLPSSSRQLFFDPHFPPSPSLVCCKTFFRPAQQETGRRIMCLLLSCLLGLDGFGRPNTKVRNLTEKPLYLQIRVGAILRKSYRLNPGCTKTLSCSNICNKYSPAEGHSTFYYDGSCEPYIWIHTNNTFHAWSTAKQQYVSLADLEACRVLSVCQDSIKKTFSLIRIYRS